MSSSMWRDTDVALALAPLKQCVRLSDFELTLVEFLPLL